MRWFELKIFTSHQAVDAVANMLYKLDLTGVVIEDPEDSIYLDSANGDWDYIDLEKVLPKNVRPIVKGYVNAVPDYEEMMNFLTDEMMNIKNAGVDIGDYKIKITEIDDQDWANEWKKYYKPFRVGKHIHIVPSWEEYSVDSPEDVVIYNDPSGAFGSGTHETTFTCLEAIEEYMDKGDLVFDIGCGSGILSVAAAKLGARKVQGVDFSEVAVTTSRENAKLNLVEKQVEFIQGNLTDDIKDKADLLVANIIADVIIELSGYVREFILDSGYFIASGIINTKYEAVVEALNANHLEIIKTINKGEWYTIVSKKR